MKKLLIAVAVVVLAYPLYPWLVGKGLERNLNQRIDALTEQVPYLTVVDRQFRRGWYRSEEDLTLELFKGMNRTPAADPAADPAAAPAMAMPGMPGPLRVTVHNVIWHGPLPGFTGLGLARVDSRFDYSPEVRAELAKVFGNQEPLSIRSYLGFLGGGSTRIQSPAFKDMPTGKEGEKVSWEGLDLTIKAGRNANHYSVRGSAPGLKVEGPNGEAVRMQGFGINLDGSRLLRHLYASNGEFHIDSVSGQSATGNFGMKDIKYAIDTAQHGDSIDIGVKLGMASMETPKGTMHDLRYDLTFAHLHTETMALMQDALSADYKQVFANPGGDTSTVSQKLIEDIKTYGLELLRHDPELRIGKVGISMPAGNFSLQGALRAKGITDADLNSPMALMVKASGEFDISMSEKLLSEMGGGSAPAAMASQQLDGLVAQGFIVRKAGDIVSKLKLDNGVLTANGKRLFPPAGMGAGAPAPGAAGN